MRKFYWYLSAFWKKHWLLIIVSIVLAIVIFSLFIPLIARRLERRQHLYIGMVGSHSLTALPADIENQLSAGLTRLKEDGLAIPAAANRWSVEDEGRTYRFIIKKDLRWQDGTPFLPTDVSYKLDGVETITTQNDVIFKLPDRYVPFPTTVTKPIFKEGVVPYWFFFHRPTLIGLGEYRLSSFKLTGNRLKEIELLSDKERLTYRFYLTEKDAVEAFKRGEVDILDNLSSVYDFKTWPTVKVEEKLHPERYLAVFFDLNNPIFAKNVRQALSYALPKPEDEKRAVGPISPDSWAYLEGGKGYDYDLTRAKERLLSELPEKPLEFELISPSVYEQKAEEIKKNWETFGQQAFDACNTNKDIKEKVKCANVKIQVNIRISNFPDTNNFQAMLIGQESPADPDQYTLWHSEQSTNFSHYKNTRIDSLLEKGRQVIDSSERKAIYQEFQQFLLEDAPAIFLEHLTSYGVERI